MILSKISTYIPIIIFCIVVKYIQNQTQSKDTIICEFVVDRNVFEIKLFLAQANLICSLRA
jgi:hypothetical protein